MLSIDDNNELLYIKTEESGASQSQKYCGYRKHRRQVLENTIKNGGGPLGGVWGGPTWGGLGGATWGGSGECHLGGSGGGHWEVY